MKRITSLLAILTLASCLFAFDNTSYIGASAGKSAHTQYEETVYGGTVFGELLFEDNWYGIAYQASVLSNFKTDLPSLDVSGGLGLGAKANIGNHFSLTLMSGLSLRVDSRPAFRDAHFFLGVYGELVANIRITDSFGLFLAWDSSYYFYHIDNNSLRSFSLTNTATVGFSHRWDPDGGNSGSYIFY